MTGRAISFSLWVLVLSPALFAGDWPGWRGPRGDGSSDETGIPTRWSKTDNVAWKVAIPGKGHSSPVIWGNRIFVTTCLEKDGQRQLLCIDRRDGKVLWTRTVVTTELERKHKLNSFASSTPATDGTYVYVTFYDRPKFLIYCYNFEGRLVWTRSPGEFHSVHGFCSPPILYKDLVILNGDQDPKPGDKAKTNSEAYIVALDKKTGEERWRANRPNLTRSYCPPVLIDVNGKKQLVMTGSLCVASYDPDTGKQIWIVQGPTEQFVASIVYANDVVFLTYGFPKLGVMGIKPDGHGDVTKSHVIYNIEKGGGYVPSPIAHGEHFYVVTDNGIAACYDCKSGKNPWRERLGKHHTASPVSAGGHLYFADDDGITWVLKAGDKFDVVAKNALEEECYASPAIAQGQMFIRTLNHLYCIGTTTRR